MKQTLALTHSCREPSHVDQTLTHAIHPLTTRCTPVTSQSAACHSHDSLTCCIVPTQTTAQKRADYTDTVRFLCGWRLTGSADSIVAGQRHVELGNRPGEGFVVRQALRGAVLPAARPEQHRLVVALLRYDLRRTRRLQHQQKQQ